jgi:ribonucleoside-diphosphate reductase beta chain
MAAALMERRREFVARHAGSFHCGTDLLRAENKRLFARNLFLAGQCLKGLQCCGLLAAAFSLLDPAKFPGSVQMLSNLLLTETHHIEVFGCLLRELAVENPEIREPSVIEELTGIMREAVVLEKSFLRDLFRGDGSSPDLEPLESFIDYVADCRLRACNLPVLNPGLPCPLPQLAALMHLHSDVGRNTAREVLTTCSDDEF